ncbi:MAG: glycine cleavage system protein H [Actinobacteria bacterium]|nr:glycine cleavage system protein H [Actinomycetota bacterium]
MATVNNCNLPDDLYYLVEKHVWARREGDDTVVVGLTDVAQNMAKTIISVGLKDVGRTVKKARSLATVESGKWVGPVPSPFDGEIVEVNQVLAADPLFSDGGVEYAVVVVRDGQGRANLPREAYRQFLEAEGIVCEA